MIAEDETIIHVTPNAAWLPTGSRAEVIRRTAPPQPVCVVRLLLRRDDRVFCIPRPERRRLDLPMVVTESDDLSGALAIRGLANTVAGHTSEVRFIGAVRNVVDSTSDGYAWPTPFAHFGVWASDDAPVIDGTWVSIEEDESVLRDRHWYPLVT